MRTGDDLGPAKVIHVHEPGLGLEAGPVVDNVARGPSIGGLRMARDVSTQECARLARAMTLKNSAAGLRHAAEVAAGHLGFGLAGARVAVQGFGAVGSHAARFLASRGALIVAASDSRGAIVDERGIVVVPDFIANADGVICAAMECAGATQAAAFESIAEKIRGNTEAVLAATKRDSVLPRAAATALATDRVRAAMATRRFSIM